MKDRPAHDRIEVIQMKILDKFADSMRNDYNAWSRSYTVVNGHVHRKRM